MIVLVTIHLQLNQNTLMILTATICLLKYELITQLKWDTNLPTTGLLFA